MWHYVKDGQNIGPEEPAVISGLIKDGTITPDTLVWQEGFTDWVPASRTELSGEFSSSPPPAPAAAPESSATVSQQPAQQQSAEGIAVASLVLGVLSWILLGPLAAIPAVICGHMALSRIKKSAAPLKGRGMALWGLILGYIQLVILVLLIGLMTVVAIPSFSRAREAAQQNSCINNLRMIDAGKEQWALAGSKDAGQAPDIAAVNEYIYGSTTPTCAEGGSYQYNTIGKAPECSVHGSLDDAYSY